MHRDSESVARFAGSIVVRGLILGLAPQALCWRPLRGLKSPGFMLASAPRTEIPRLCAGVRSADFASLSPLSDSNESFVVIDSIRLQELNELVPKTNLLMVFLLPSDVVPHFFDIGLAHGKGSIATLP
jgi:hypothetical protein